MQNVEFVNRKTGEKVVEKVPGAGMMRFLYSQNFLGKFMLWAVIKRRLLSVIMSWYMDSAISVKSVTKFVKKHNLDLSDYEIPNVGFKHFNQFFYRKLKTGARPIGEGIVSPADGKILVFPTMSSTQKFYIKGEEFDLKKFLNDDSLANDFEGGSMAVIRLAPTDYHRFHFPIEGYVKENVKVTGSYYSVSPLALQKNMRIFWENKRDYVTLESDEVGQVLLSEIGATLTGSIVQSHWPNINVQKGEEKGYFRFGGSTVIMLFEKGKIVFSQDLLNNTENGLETAVLMGESVGAVS